MDNNNFNKIEIERLYRRVESLENKMQNLSRLLIQMGENFATDGSSAIYTDESRDEETLVKTDKDLRMDFIDLPKKKDSGENIFFETDKITEATKIWTDEDNSALAVNHMKFVEKYTSGANEFDLYLEVAKDLTKELKRFLDWDQVPNTVKEKLFLEEAYDFNMYYADCEQVQDEFLYFVAPAEPDVKYEQRDFIKLALPSFFDIEYSSDLERKLLKLIKPAIFMQDDKGRYVLKVKGKIILTR